MSPLGKALLDLIYAERVQAGAITLRDRIAEVEKRILELVAAEAAEHRHREAAAPAATPIETTADVAAAPAPAVQGLEGDR